ncbi:hypothetical protein PybrP1_011649 [[Pythium] brassicae (nom. inval.)]|nr:hypothetical protein PybrP1_011649 [[Pythium] brassicae (nom. inval.)]
MYRVMSPDEYMHGVIYFYTDMILLAVVCVAAVGAVAACVALITGGDCDCDCSCGDCGGCYGGGGSADECRACTWTDCCDACNVWLWWSNCTSSSRSSDCTCGSCCERKHKRTAYRDVDEPPGQPAPPSSDSEWDEPPPQKPTSAGAVREQQIQRV